MKIVNLANSTDVTNLLVDEFKISMETTSGDASLLDENNERQKISIQNMLRAYILDSNQTENKWCCAARISAEVHRCKIHSSLKTSLLSLHGMVKILASMNLEYLDVIYTPSHHLLKS